jgi:hypothetical protein
MMMSMAARKGSMFFLQKPPGSGYSASVVDAVNRAPPSAPFRIETAGAGPGEGARRTERVFDRGGSEWVYQ